MDVPLYFETSLSGAPRLIVGRVSFELGDDLSNCLGFDECRLDRDLLHIILALALRKQGEAGSWMSADELGVLARAGATGSSTAKRLELVLCAKPRSGTGPRLIEFWQSQSGSQRFRGGRSRGPYRLGADIDVSHFDSSTALMTLTGVTDPDVSPCEPDDDTSLLVAARTSLDDGQFIRGKRLVDAALDSLYRHSLTSFGGADERTRTFALAEAQVLLANIDLELGRSEQGLLAASAAQELFARLHHPLGIAYALQVEAHLRGQIGGQNQAARSIAAAKRALIQLDNGPRSTRKGVSRAIYVGTLGWRLAAAGRSVSAARGLRTALRMAQESGSEAWAGIWAFRIAQNDIVRQDLGSAERHMTLALEHQSAMGVSATAALARAATEFNLAAGLLDEAEQWLNRARLIGRTQNMAYQDRLVTALATHLNTRR